MDGKQEKLAALRELADRMTEQIMDGLLAAVKCCPNCDHWKRATEQCGEIRNCPQGPARPPATVIAHGCDYFKSEIPF